jgi:glyoxylase-like metal-dependent hydrolase (beta-lactamase superfamily II)
MVQILPDIFLIEGLRRSNVYLLVSPDGLTLVDSGVPGEAGIIVDQLRKEGFAPADLRNIVLTHAHFDHAGNVAEIARFTGARVLAHKDEVPYLEQTRVIPMRSFIQRLMSLISARVLPRNPPCHVDLALEDGDLIEATGGYRALHTPGHTPGSICLYRPERGILFCGDAFFNRHPITGKKGLQVSIPMVTSDMAQARDSVRKLSTLDIDSLFCGHGEPILKGAGALISALAQASG